MAGSAYVGIPGSGKSYEVVLSVLLPALKTKRRVVTNLSNLQIDEIRAYLVEHGMEPDQFGSVVEVGIEDVQKPGFFPVFDEKEKRVVKIGLVEGGDLIIIDEVWRYWPAGASFTKEHMSFFRLHRQITSEDGLSCDLVVISQDIWDIDRKLRSILESTFRMTKHRFIGRPEYYRVDVFSGGKIARKAISSFQRKYDKEIFALYSSYASKKGVEAVADERINIFNSSGFKYGVPIGTVIFLILVGIIWYWYKKLTAPAIVDKPVAEQKQGVSGPASPGAPGAPGEKKAAPSGNGANALPGQNKESASDVWRVVGYSASRTGVYFMLADSTGKSRVLFDPPSQSWRPGGVEIGLPEGGKASWVSGSSGGPSLLGMRR